MGRIRFGIMLFALPFFVGCNEVPTENDAGPVLMAAKGGNKPKPPGGGGGATADPAIAFVYGGALRVMNADGSANTLLIDGVSRGVSWSPDATQVAYAPGGGGSASTIMVAQLALVNGVPVVASATDLALPHPSAPVWSPLGDLIAYGGSCDPGEPDGTCGTWGYNNHLRVIPSGGGAASTLYESPGCADPWDCRILTPAWSPDASQLAFVEMRGPGNVQSLRYMGVADAPTTVSQPLIDPGAFASMCTPDWSPDGSTIAFWGRATSEAPTSLWVLDVATRATTNIGLQATLGCADVSWSPDGTRWVVDTGDAIRLVDVATGQVIPRRKSKLAQGVSPEWRRCDGPGCGLAP